jgi:hypothetical protein
MKRFFVLFTAGLLLAVAAPTMAAPDLGKNKLLMEITIDCDGSTPVDLGEFTVKAKSTPGWPLDWDGVNTPIQYRTSTIEFFADGVSQWTWYDAPPPGLEPKLVGPCEFSYEWDWEGVHYRVQQTDAYFTFPRPWE